MDVLSKKQRSYCMSQIGGRNTKPEVTLRKALFADGLRYRLHKKDLPGKPDIVLPKHRAVIFVHGCFWHGHGCPLFVVPATNRHFWVTKISSNRSRDERNCNALVSMGWRVLTVWECALRGPCRLPLNSVVRRVHRWLYSKRPLESMPATNRPRLNK